MASRNLLLYFLLFTFTIARISSLNVIADVFMESGTMGDCGETVTNKENVYIRSHLGAYQLGSMVKYGADKNCELTFLAGTGKTALVKFLKFELENQVDGVCVDGLKIYDRSSVVNITVNTTSQNNATTAENCTVTSYSSIADNCSCSVTNYSIVADNCSCTDTDSSSVADNCSCTDIDSSSVADNCSCTVTNGSSLANNCSCTVTNGSSVADNCSCTVTNGSSVADNCSCTATNDSSISNNCSLSDNCTETDNATLTNNSKVGCSTNNSSQSLTEEIVQITKPKRTVCGSSGLAPFVSDGPEVRFEFYTNKENHFSGFLLLVTAFREDNVCTENEFKCDTNRCIPKDLTCDTVEHCVDGTDEQDTIAGCTILDKVIGYLFGLGKLTVITIAVLVGVFIFTIVSSVILYHACCKKKNRVRPISDNTTNDKTGGTGKTKTSKKVIVVAPESNSREIPPTSGKKAWDKKSKKKTEEDDDSFW